MDIIQIIILTITMISGFLIIYHHALFPLFLKKISVKNNISKTPDMPNIEDKTLPTITLIIPAYNEEDYVSDKIYNISSLNYPKDKLNVVLYCDGCTDNTYHNALNAVNSAMCEDLNITIEHNIKNIGKTAALNKLISATTTDIVALSDVSALISIDALYIAAQHFSDNQIGVVAGTYNILETANQGEETYWAYQTGIKKGESALGGPIGAHGAFYLFRRELFTPLVEGTINDDFVLPMKIMLKGYNAVYEPHIMALELESADHEMDYKRRCRLAAGNVQQIFQMYKILHPKHKGISLSFLSGKVLRVFAPVLLLICLFGSFSLSFSDVVWIKYLFMFGFISQSAAYSIALYKTFNMNKNSSKIINLIHYTISGHFAGLIGIGLFIKQTMPLKKKSFVHSLVSLCKRSFDIFASLLGLSVGIFIMPFIALAVKLDSKGAIIFKQIRIGEGTEENTKLFMLYKFRTMVADAEKNTGAVWAQKNDPRVTRVGKFLRKTRLDELPQLINVLKGEMSIIGPRPERPGITGNLNNKIPFFAERTYGVRPGITGLAQVYNGYDETLDDARQKAAYDHAYAVTLSNPLSWLLMDLKILFKTVGVVVGARGQ